MVLKPSLDTDASIYEVLKCYGPLTRGELKDYTGLARTTIYDALRRLQLNDLIWRAIKKRRGRGLNGVYLVGRPYTVWGVVDE